MRIAAILAMSLVLCACGNETPADPATTLPVASSADAINGHALYVQHCLLCHQQDGGGVPNMQPPLLESKVASGEAGKLIEIVLRGVGGQSPPALPASGNYAMVMPSAATLGDQDIADLLTYIRQAFVQAKPIGPDQVAAERSKLE